ncbi:MAG: response regulator [Syntrophobacteraceae bacterium]|nr:response regulator [Syntrophobacteraceae bacterium]
MRTRLGLNQKIGIAMGSVLFIIVLLGGGAWLNLRTIGSTTDVVETRLYKTLDADTLVMKLIESGALTSAYAIKMSESDLKAAQSALDSLAESLAKVASTSTDTGNATRAYQRSSQTLLSSIGEQRTACSEFDRAATALNTTSSALAYILTRENRPEMLPAAFRLYQISETGTAQALRYLANRDPAYVATAKNAIGDFAPALGTLRAAAADSPRIQKILVALQSQIAVFSKALDAMIASTDKIEAARAQRQVAVNSLIGTINDLRTVNNQEQSAAIVAMHHAMGASLSIVSLLSLLAIAVVALAGLFIVRKFIEGKQAREKLTEYAQQIELQNRELDVALGRASAATRAKSEFLARMSHEIRTPMNSVIGFTDILLDTNLAVDQSDYAKTIKRSGEALLDLINDILDFSRMEAGQMTLESVDFDPETIACDVCDLIRPKLNDKPIDVLCRIADDVPGWVKGDPGRFRQVLVNLMGNAVKFTESGEIEISMGLEEARETGVKLRASIRDTGIGVTPDKLEKIFEEFRQADGFNTRKYEGSGLGLAISRQISRLMGGDVTAESSLGEGAVFHFTAWFEKSKGLKKTDVVRMPSFAGARVLVADDNANNLEILNHILSRAGLRVTSVSQATDILPVLLKGYQSDDPCRLAIIDICMPDMTGFAVAKQIREQKSGVAQTPLLAYSSSVTHGSRSCIEAGFNGFLVKPASRKRLLEEVAQLLGTAREPVVHIERPTISSPPDPFAGNREGLRILLAEDNLVNVKLATVLLTNAGFTVVVANNGQEAVAKYTASPELFDLILMDIQMPVMDGLKATRAIREKGFDKVPIIAMTANAMKGDRENCQDAGMNDYVSKPIRREKVFAVIKKWSSF